MYDSTIWSLIVSTTNITKLQTIYNTTLRITIGCIHHTNIQYLSHTHTTLSHKPYHTQTKKQTTFNNYTYITHIKKSHLHTPNKHKTQHYSHYVLEHQEDNQADTINSTTSTPEVSRTIAQRRTLACLRTNRSLFILAHTKSMLHTILPILQHTGT